MELTTNLLSVENISYLLVGAGISIFIAFGAMIIGITLGVVVAPMRISKNKFLRSIAYVYIEFIRGTPMVLQILIIYLGMPVLYTNIFGGRIDLDPILVGVIAIGINSGAYSAELIRSGIESIDSGQWEAGKSLGLNYRQTMRFIILPQVFRRVIPPFVSEFIMLIKDSSLIFTIGGFELLGRAKVIGARNYDYIGPLVMAACIYLIMTTTISYFARKVERRYAVND